MQNNTQAQSDFLGKFVNAITSSLYPTGGHVVKSYSGLVVIEDAGNIRQSFYCYITDDEKDKVQAIMREPLKIVNNCYQTIQDFLSETILKNPSLHNIGVRDTGVVIGTIFDECRKTDKAAVLRRSKSGNQPLVIELVTTQGGDKYVLRWNMFRLPTFVS